MKKLLAVMVVVAFSLPIVAWGASNYVTSFTDGNYTGTITSVAPSINGKTAKLEVKHEGTNVVGTVTYEGGKEVWTWNDTTLTQKEIDLKTNKPGQQYGATAANPAAGTRQTYNVNCANRAANQCDADIDSRNYWILETAPNTVKYIVWGVPSDKKGDATAPVQKRHEFIFTKAN